MGIPILPSVPEIASPMNLSSLNLSKMVSVSARILLMSVHLDCLLAITVKYCHLIYVPQISIGWVALA